MTADKRIAELEKLCASKDQTIAALASANAELVRASTEAVRKVLVTSDTLAVERRQKAETKAPEKRPSPFQPRAVQARERDEKRVRPDPEKEFSA
jgi:uncharacterized coiled-coil protein SlyX